jgi:hypothetical protein
VLPEDGLESVLLAVEGARRSLDIQVFLMDGWLSRNFSNDLSSRWLPRLDCASTDNTYAASKGTMTIRVRILRCAERFF